MLTFPFFFSVHVVIKEQLALSLLRDGGVQSMELKGEMNLQISDASSANVRLTLASTASDFGNSLQFKQHPNVAKFAPGKERIIALKDSSRSFPVNQSLAVLKWRYAGTDESNVPLSSMFSAFFTWIQNLISFFLLQQSTAGQVRRMTVLVRSV